MPQVLECEDNGKAVACSVTIVQIRTPNERQKLKLADVEDAVCRYFNIYPVALRGPGRARRFVYPRHIFCYLAYEYTGLSMPQIGRKIGDRDHTTVLHGARKIAKLIETDPETAEHVKQLKAMLFIDHEPTVDQSGSAVAALSQLDMAEKHEISLSKLEIQTVG